MAVQGVMLGPSGDPRSIKNRTFGCRSTQVSSKNDLWKGIWKKHENWMKNGCQNECLLMARKHVWRYTLGLIHTFVLFETNRKICFSSFSSCFSGLACLRHFRPKIRILHLNICPGSYSEVCTREVYLENVKTQGLQGNHWRAIITVL